MSDTASVPVAILAGGLGSRLRTIVQNRQKVVADVSGHPFLHYLLKQLEQAGFRRVVVCTGHLGEQVSSFLRDTPAGLDISISEETEPLGTAGALRLALPKLTGPEILVMNGDSFCDTDLCAFIRWHRATGSSASLLLASVPDTARFGRVSVDENGQVKSFEEKGKTGPGVINAGIYLVKNELLAAIPDGKVSSLEKDVFPDWVSRGALRGFSASVNRFIDIGTPESYAEAQQLFKD